MAAEIRRVVNRKRVPPLQPSQFMQEIGFSVVTPISLPFLPLPSPFFSLSPFIFRVCSCHPAEVVSRTPLCAQSTFLSGLNTSRPDYRTESNSFEIGGRGAPLKSRLQIRFRVSMPTVCVYSLFGYYFRNFNFSVVEVKARALVEIANSKNY